MKHSTLEKQFQKIIIALKIVDIKANSKQIDLWFKHLSLLQKYNKIYNLTAITDIDQMLTKHLLDSLVISKFITRNSIIDIGTGAGFPGIPLAILTPEKSYVLIDSIAKKIRFVDYVKNTLKLNNIKSINTRVENYQPVMKFDHVVSRALSSIQKFYNFGYPLLKETGSFLVMKGNKTEENKLQNLPVNHRIFKLKVPFLEAKRHLILMNPNK